MNRLDYGKYNDCIVFKPLGDESGEIASFGERYSINATGIVYDRSLNRYIFHQNAGIPPYRYVNLQVGNIRKMKRINRLIALTWLDNPKCLPFVDHIDRNPHNNCTYNLRWISRGGNRQNSNMMDKAKIGELSFGKCYKCEHKGVSKECCGTYTVTFCKETMGTYKNKIFAARVYDTAIRMMHSKENITYLNFPEEDCLDESCLFKYARNNKNYIQQVTIEKIRYIYQYENITIGGLADRFKTNHQVVRNIVEDCKKKEPRKEVNCWNLDTEIRKAAIRRLYTSGKTRKEICQIYGYKSLSSLGRWLPKTRTNSKPISMDIRRKIALDFQTGGYTRKELAVKYNITYNMVKNIILGKVKY